MSRAKLTRSKVIDARPKKGVAINPIPVAAEAAVAASNAAEAPAILDPVISPSSALSLASTAPRTAPTPGIIDFPSLPNAFVALPPVETTPVVVFIFFKFCFPNLFLNAFSPYRFKYLC